MINLFEMMAHRLEQPDMAGLLVAYRDDFDVIDREVLVEWGAPGNEYLWFVREHGTALLRLGVHPKPVEWFTCAMDLVAKGKVFHVTDRGVKELARVEALRMIGAMEYSLQAGCESDLVMHYGVAIAAFSVRAEPRVAQTPLYHLQADSLVTLVPQQVGALRTIMLAEVETRFGVSAAVGSMTMDGADMSQAMKTARQRQHPQVRAI